MDISPNEAEEALAAIQEVAQRTRRSISSSGAYVTLMVTGVVWLVGFFSTQFLTGMIVAYIWVGMSLLGTAVSIPLGRRMGRRVHNVTASTTTRRMVLFWLFLLLLAVAAILVAHPTDGKQLTTLIVLFIMIGQMAMGLLLSFTATWWALLVAALALIGYFLFPGIFYLWMAVLVGGGMIALAFYIRSRW
jgi:hypothetical protein